MDPARLKADAGAALAAGHFSRAASLYAAYCASAPRDRQSHLRLGDAYARAGEKAHAIDAYLTAARGFAEDGFLARAIAASKLVLELDPNHTQMQRILADLYAKRAAGGQALRTLLGKTGASSSKDEPLPVRPFETLAAEAPAVALRWRDGKRRAIPQSCSTSTSSEESSRKCTSREGEGRTIGDRRDDRRDGGDWQCQVPGLLTWPSG